MKALLALLALAVPASAHDLPRVEIPDSTTVVLEPFWPEWNRIAGEGHVRLVYHSPELAVRMGVDEFHAYERAYQRSLASLMLRMPLHRADPIARHAAWHAVAGRPDRTNGYTTETIPTN